MGTGKRESARKRNSKFLPVDAGNDSARLEFVERLKKKNIKVTGKDHRWLRVKKGNLEAQILYFAEPSEFGINEGRISKLWMKDKKIGDVVVHYDRGWDIEPPEEGPARDLFDDILGAE